MAGYFQEKGGEFNSLFGLILFWTLVKAQIQGEKKIPSYFRQHSKDIKQEQKFLSKKEAGTSLLISAPLYTLIICLNLERKWTSKGRWQVEKMEQNECLSPVKVWEVVYFNRREKHGWMGGWMNRRTDRRTDFLSWPHSEQSSFVFCHLDSCLHLCSWDTAFKSNIIHSQRGILGPASKALKFTPLWQLSGGSFPGRQPV